jgi:hypothetical protein
MTDLRPRRFHPHKHHQNRRGHQHIGDKKQTDAISSKLRKKKMRIKSILKKPRKKLRVGNCNAKQAKEQVNVFAIHRIHPRPEVCDPANGYGKASKKVSRAAGVPAALYERNSPPEPKRSADPPRQIKSTN